MRRVLQDGSGRRHLRLLADALVRAGRAFWPSSLLRERAAGAGPGPGRAGRRPSHVCTFGGSAPSGVEPVCGYRKGIGGWVGGWVPWKAAPPRKGRRAVRGWGRVCGRGGPAVRGRFLALPVGPRRPDPRRTSHAASSRARMHTRTAWPPPVGMQQAAVAPSCDPTSGPPGPGTRRLAAELCGRDGCRAIAGPPHTRTLAGVAAPASRSTLPHPARPRCKAGGRGGGLVSARAAARCGSPPAGRPDGPRDGGCRRLDRQDWDQRRRVRTRRGASGSFDAAPPAAAARRGLARLGHGS